MMVLARRIVFYLFVLVYLIACPLTILSAFGYLVTPGTRRGFLKTGLIDISTLPPGAAVYVGHRRYTQRTPTVLQELRPGAYPLRLMLKHHRSWTRTVRVEAEQATVLERILLLPTTLTTRVVLADRYDQLLPVPETPFALLKKGSRLRDVVIYNGANETAQSLLPPDDPLGESRMLSHVMVRGSSFVVLRVDTQDGERVLGVELPGLRPRVMDLTSLLPPKLLSIVWDPRAPQRLFVLQRGGDLYRVDIARRAIASQVLTGVRGVGAGQKSLYVLTDEGLFQRLDEDGRRLEVLFYEPDIGRSLFGLRGEFQITVLAKELIFLLGERGELVSARLPSRLAQEGVKGFEFDRRRERVLVWTKNKLGVVDCVVDCAAPPALRWIFDQGRDLEQAFWVYQGSHVLLRDRESLWLVESDAPGEPGAQPLGAVREGSSAWYVEERGLLYALDPATGRLMATTLLPKREPGALRQE